MRPDLLVPAAEAMISRPRTSILGMAALGFAGVIGRHLSGYVLDGKIAARLRVLSAKEYLILAAIARRVLAGDGPSADEVEAALHADDYYLQQVPAPLVSDVRSLLSRSSTRLRRGRASRIWTRTRRTRCCALAASG